ncbi:histone lysine N methyltransferase [Echinococcus multilocularis]|uniref:Histone lysine N methyltransferase n=1 Tax=Echinococcus multilocularis TaxID=6211 RepID=A0A068Y296_ECHMU|nr:histone lysine N methyltransferase [Echinococcus multilocularis]
MRPKKSKKRGSSGGSLSKSPPPTPVKSVGRRGRPPSKSPTAAPLPAPSLPSRENHNHSLSPDHSRTSSSDQDIYQGHTTAFISKPVQPLDTAGAPTNSTSHPAYISPNDTIDRPRKLAKRERKALIKSSRRTRAVIDESFVANMNELSDIFQSNCGVGPCELHPIPMATDPSKPPPLLPSISPPRGGKGRGGGRRGKPSSLFSAPRPAVASLTPLCLPFGGLPNRLKSPTTPLKQLTPRCVRRFLKAVNGILEPSTTVTRLFQPLDVPSSIIFPPPPVSVPPTSGAIPNEPNGFCGNNESINNHVAISSQCKRGRGRPPKSSIPVADPTVTKSPILLDLTANTTDILTAQPVVPVKTPLKSRRNLTGTPRELRALLTWDTMMKASQESGGPSGPGGDFTSMTSSAADPTSPLSLQIVSSGTGDETSDQRTTRGRSRRLSTGPASSGSFTEAESVHHHLSQQNSVSMGFEVSGVASSTPGSELIGSNFIEGGVAEKNELHRPFSLSPNRGVGGKSRSSGNRKRRTTSPSLPPPLPSTPPSATDTAALEQGASQASPTLASPLLPPRKRYKVVGSGGESGEMTSSTATASASASHHLHNDNTEDEDNDLEFGIQYVDDSNASESVSPHGDHHQQRDVPIPTVAAVTTAAAAASTLNGKRRPRGRPSKRTYSPNGRPRREAAAMGFASMVASSINATSMLSMVEGNEVASLNPTTTTVTAEAVDVKKEEVAPPSKRGRKPKKAVVPSLTGAAPKPRGRPPKHPRPFVEEPILVDLEDKKPIAIAPDIFIELKPPYMVSPEVQDEVECVKPMEHLEASKKRELKKSKRGRRPASSASSPPPAKRREMEENEENRLIYGSHQLRLFLLRNHYSRRKAKANSPEGINLGLTKTQQFLAAGQIAKLPTRTGFFPFSSLADKIVEDVGNKEGEEHEEKVWVHQLYSRLLDTSDLCDPSTRLTSPLLSLPCPLRCPEFYRFICGSGLLNNFESALECENSIQPRILGTVSPDIVSQSEIKTAPFYPSGSGWPPLCLRDIVPRLGIVTGGFQQLDLLLEFLFRTWEAYAGRRSWVGKQLQQIRSLYNQLRTEHVANHPEKQLPLPSAGLASGSAKGSGPIIAGSGVARKKVDRQTLERGAEVISCLCGFRVEGGHVMVQCNACVTRQHLPCVWWALCLDMNPRLAAPATPLGATWPCTARPAASPLRLALCRAALAGALAAGGHNISWLLSLSDTSPDSCPVYYCPNCLELDGLTKDYPRTLAASLEVHNVAAVFSKTAKRHEYWSLGTDEEQFLTDEFAIIHRRDYEAATTATPMTNLLEEFSSRPPLAKASDAVVVRIYQLWKDANGRSWMEGGAFLRPYDLPSSLSYSLNTWHPRELIYDETSRLVLPLSTLRGRCCVLSPTTYRLGRPADLPAVVLPLEEMATPPTDHHPLVFLCERLVTKNEEGELIVKDIAPAYLKVITKPYYFLRHPETSSLRAAITRTFTSQHLLHLDSATRLGEIISCGVESGRLFADSVQRRWVDEAVPEAVKQDTSIVATPPPPRQSSTMSSKRPRERSLNAVLPLLKSLSPTGLPSTTAAVTTVFHHGSRKSSIVKSSLPRPPTPGLSSPKKRVRSTGAIISAPAIKHLSFTELQQQIALRDESLTKDSVPVTPKRRGRKPKVLASSLTHAPAPIEQLRVDVDTEIKEEGEKEGEEDDTREGCLLEPSISPKLAEVTSVMDSSFSCESITVTGMLQQVAPVACGEVMPGVEEVEVEQFHESVSPLPPDAAFPPKGIGALLRECCLQQQPIVEGCVVECADRVVRKCLEAVIVEVTCGANRNDLLRTSPPPCLIAPPRRVPRVLFEEYENWEEGSVLDLPDVEYLNPTEILSIVSKGNEEEEKEAASSLLRLSPPIVLEASDLITVRRPTIDRNDEVMNETEGQEVEEEDEEEEEEPYQPISSASESNSDTSNDNPVGSTAPTVLATVPSVPVVVTVEADATSRERHYSNTSTTAAASAVVSVPTITRAISSSSGSSSRRRKGSSPKKRVFDDPERILDLSAKSSAVDE